jgi:NTP pyrophosphatase (non-canonical NTP hydrolase)
MTPEHKDTCRAAVHHYGADAQTDQAIEECLELALILQRLKRKDRPVAPPHIITEIADVAIMVEQLAIIYGPTAVADQVDLKMRRLAQRIALVHCTHTPA